jgi:hypothetical protein
MNKGLIKISNELYVSEWDIIMKYIRPTHIEFRHWENDVWYIYGVSDKFEPVKEGEAVPEYNVIISISGKKTSFKFEKL